MEKVWKKILMELSYSSNKYLLPLEYISLIITNNCNFRCQSCSIWQNKNFKELPERKWLNIANKLKSFNPNTFIEINGGEPLIRKGLTLKLIQRLKRNFKKITLNTNGLLINQNLIDELEKAGLDTIKISFYSLDKNIHNSLRGNPKAYNHGLKAIKGLRQSKIKTEVGILITSKNIAGLPKLIIYLQRLKNISIILQPLDESINSKASKERNENNLIDKLWPEPKEVKSFFNWLNKNSAKIKNSPAQLKAIKEYYLSPKGVLKYRCFAGQRSLIIQPNGKVFLCFKGQQIGDLTKEKIENILKSKRSQKERNAIKECQKYCRIIGCNFSRSFIEFLRK